MVALWVAPVLAGQAGQSDGGIAPAGKNVTVRRLRAWKVDLLLEFVGVHPRVCIETIASYYKKGIPHTWFRWYLRELGIAPHPTHR